MSKPCGHDEHAEGGSQQVQAGFDKGSLAETNLSTNKRKAQELRSFKIIPSYFQLQVVLSETKKLWKGTFRKDNWTKERKFFHKSFKDSQLCDFSWEPNFLECDLQSVIYRTNQLTIIDEIYEIWTNGHSESWWMLWVLQSGWFWPSNRGSKRPKPSYYEDSPIRGRWQNRWDACDVFSCSYLYCILYIEVSV